MTYRDTIRLNIHEITRQLIADLGVTLVAFMAGTRTRSLPYKWAQDDGPVPRDEAFRRLQTAHRVWSSLGEHPDIRRAWFIGANPILQEKSPAEAIREDQVHNVLTAAAQFARGL